MKKIILLLFIAHYSSYSQEKLEVGGAIIIQNSEDTTPAAGTIRWTGTDFEGWNGTEWMSLTTPGINHVHNPTTGKIWMDRNLGASQVATSSTDANAYGDLYQWGRGTDGHQIRTSDTTFTLSNSDTPGHGNFILAPDPFDWRSPQNDTLWQGVNGVNNPCPAGYRLPTEAELEAERASWASNNAAGAFASPLKLPVAGRRGGSGGSLFFVGSSGVYWSSTVDGAGSRSLFFGSMSAGMVTNGRAFGSSVRCLKD